MSCYILFIFSIQQCDKILRNKNFKLETRIILTHTASEERVFPEVQNPTAKLVLLQP